MPARRPSPVASLPPPVYASCCCGTVVDRGIRVTTETLFKINSAAKCCEDPKYLFLTLESFKLMEPWHKARLLAKNPEIERRLA